MRSTECLLVGRVMLSHYYIRQRSWANVMYSSPFVTLQNRRFLQSILVTAVCLSVCLFVCLSVCLFVRLFARDRSNHRSNLSEKFTADIFSSKDAGNYFW